LKKKKKKKEKGMERKLQKGGGKRMDHTEEIRIDRRREGTNDYLVSDHFEKEERFYDKRVSA